MRLNSHQQYLQDLVEHHRRWEPCGGSSPEDLMIHFGLTPVRFRQRILEAARSSELNEYWATKSDLRIRILRAANWIGHNTGTDQMIRLKGA